MLTEMIETEKLDLPGSLTAELAHKFKHLWYLVGNTPMIELQYTFQGKPGKVYVKCENFNFTGSVKDRIALNIMFEAYISGALKAGDTIVEATSGNTGIAFAAIGRALGHRVKIVMPNWLNKERIDIIKSMGAEVILVSKEEGGFLGSIRICEELAAAGGVFLPRQFENANNGDAHDQTTGMEIWEQISIHGLCPDAFVAGVGTGGTVMGVGKRLKSLNPLIKIHPLEPAESPTLTTGYKVGSHRIQGISDEFIPASVRLDELDEVLQANDGDAIIMAQKMASELGLAVGISSGANVVGAVKLQQEMGIHSVVVTIFADSNKKYPSTDLAKEEPVKSSFISTDTIFTGYNVISRLK